MIPNSQKTDAVFQECYQRYAGGERNFWRALADQYEFTSEEALRSWFRRQLQSRNLLTKAQEAELSRKSGFPNILLFDLEITDLLLSGWRTGKQYVSYDQILEDSVILAYAAKWLGNGDAFGSILTPSEYARRDDKRLIEDFLGVFNDADIVLAFNGSGFDIPVLNTRMAFHRMHPYEDTKLIDPLVTVKTRFHLNSNKLADVLHYFGLPPKTHAGRELWKRIRRGDEKAFHDMLEYNINDAAILEDLYILLRPWMKNHPNLTVFHDSERRECPTCLSTSIKKSSRPYRTGMNTYAQYRCLDCGTVFRARQGEHNAKDYPLVGKQIER